ncbi:MAG: hypothetical protein NT062_10745 [Proteobacteria bacterium]|nr:hypothetical protein [Pseudomonadota bacterium]
MKEVEMESWQRMVVDCLRDLSDAALQNRLWGDSEPKQPSPTEIVNQLFDDSGLGDLLDAGPVFSPEADLILKGLSLHIDSIDFDQSIEDLLADERWIGARQLAATALRAVDAVLENPAESS